MSLKVVVKIMQKVLELGSSVLPADAMTTEPFQTYA
jgi:hypothetical protein